MFLKIVHSAYLGKPFNYKGSTFNLRPTLVPPSDFTKRVPKPTTEYESLLDRLPSNFRKTASAEIYRKKDGWVGRRRGQLEVRKTKFGKKEILLPVLSDSATGFDSSGIRDISTVFAFCVFTDPEAGYAYLEKHLNLPKKPNHREYKWRDLDPKFKAVVSDNYNALLELFCEAILVIETNALISPIEKPARVVEKLIDGCFSGYEYQRKFRLNLKEKFFSLVNERPIHCDPDVPRITREGMVKIFVKTLAKRDSRFYKYTPVHVILNSHQSHPIQLADLIVGCIKSKIQNGEVPPCLFSRLPFDARKIKKVDKKRKVPTKTVRVFYWIKK